MQGRWNLHFWEVERCSCKGLWGQKHDIPSIAEDQDVKWTLLVCYVLDISSPNWNIEWVAQKNRIYFRPAISRRQDIADWTQWRLKYRILSRYSHPCQETVRGHRAPKRTCECVKISRVNHTEVNCASQCAFVEMAVAYCLLPGVDVVRFTKLVTNANLKPYEIKVSLNPQ